LSSSVASRQSVAVTADGQEAIEGDLTMAKEGFYEVGVTLLLPLKLDFHNIFIGHGKPLEAEHDDSFFTVQLEELSSAKVTQLYNQCEGKEFAIALKPYLTDLLKRKQGFQTVLDIFVNALTEEEKLGKMCQGISLPDLLLELTVKDIFVSLLEVTPHSAHARLLSLYAHLHCAIPLVYTLQTSLEEIETVSNFHALEELLAIPSYPLVVSCGTETTVGRGKSSLMGQLIGRLENSSLSSDSFEIQTSKGSGGPTHLPSIDLALEVKADVDKGLNVADVHGFTTETDFCRALSTLCSVAALVVVHITREDLLGDCSPAEGLRLLLFRCCSLRQCNAKVVFLFRDLISTTSGTSESLLLSASDSLAKVLPPNTVFDVIRVENLLDCRTDSHRQKAVVRVRDRIGPLLRGLKRRLPCFEIINELHGSPRLSQHISTKIEFGDLKEGFSKLGRQVYEILDKSMPNDSRLSDFIFPLTTIYAAIARIRQREKELLEQDVQSQRDRSELGKLAAELRDLDKRKHSCQISKAVQLFVSLVKQEKFNEIGQFQRYVEHWKAQYVNPRLDRRRNLMNQLQSLDEAIASSEQESSIRRDLEILSDQIDQLDVSVDLFWSELMELCALQEDDTVDWQNLRSTCGLETALVKRVYTQCVVEGYPIQLLRGNPLQITASQFLKDIFRELDSRGKSKVTVVSVIGTQSSAKSTLLNYLFGCGFATRAGRCTKGLYASYVDVSDGRRLLILDSEGLLSLEGGGRVFDGQITVMAMACSDIVIVNHKGEISADIKELLEVCLYAMDYLKVANRQPEMLFVLRDQRDRNTKMQDNALALMKKLLKDAIGSYQLNLYSLISLKQEAVFLLPSAFSEQQHEGRPIERPSLEFSKEAFTVRSKMLHWTREAESAIDASAPEDSPFVDWYRDACIVWDTLTKYGHTLLHYKALHDLQLHKEMTDLVKVIVKDLVESERGFNGQAAKIVSRYTIKLQAEKEERNFVRYDADCTSELEELKDCCHQEINHAFYEKTDSKKYNQELKETFRVKLGTPVIHAYSIHVYTWQMQLKVAKDRVNIEAIDRHFVLRTDELLKSNEYQCAMSEAKALEIFKDEWNELEREFYHRLQSTKRDREDIKQEVAGVFRGVLGRHKHDNEILAVVAQSQPNRRDSRPWSVESDNKVWFEQYMEIKRADIFHIVYDALAYTGMPVSADDVICYLVPRVKTIIKDFLNEVCVGLSQSDKLDAAVVSDVVLWASGKVGDIEKLIKNYNRRLKLRRAPFVNDFFVYLQQTAVQFVCSAEETRIIKETRDLEKTKLKKRKKFLDMVSEDAGDVKRANVLAESYNETIEFWVQSKVVEFTSKIRDQVLKEMPDPEKAAARAYNLSFERGNYREVLEYCVDVNSYLKKLFFQAFNKQKQAALDQHEDRLREDVSEMYRTLRASAEQWKKSIVCDPDRSTGTIKLNDFKLFLQSQADDVNQPESIRDRRVTAMNNFPEMSNFRIARVEVFCNAFIQKIGTCLSKADNFLTDQIGSKMDGERRQLWCKLRGCTEKCPLCGSKCSLVNEHVDHECAHHVLPAFHGVSTREDNHTWLKMCRSEENAEAGWWRDDTLHPDLASYLSAYQDCKAWKKSLVPPDPALKHVPIEQIEAWMNCKKPLIAHWKMVDKTPSEWSCHESSSPLAESEFDAAVKRLQEYRWN
jgi:hypothetical protein